MDAVATRSHPLNTQTGHPLKAKPCTCTDEPAGDLSEMTCWRCGKQVGGAAPKARGAFSLYKTSALPAAKRRRYRPAP